MEPVLLFQFSFNPLKGLFEIAILTLYFLVVPLIVRFNPLKGLFEIAINPLDGYRRFVMFQSLKGIIWNCNALLVLAASLILGFNPLKGLFEIAIQEDRSITNQRGVFQSLKGIIWNCNGDVEFIVVAHKVSIP